MAVGVVQQNYQDPFPMDDTDPRVLKNYSLKSGNRSESLLSRKSKHKSESRQRLLAELSRIYPDLHLTSSPTPSPPSESKSSHSKRSDPSPTDSHAHRRPDSHQPSRKRSNDSSFSSILLITTERLHSETARANSAEKQIGDVMSLFRNTHEQKVKLERELLRVKEELSMYKVQLEVAQKEIFRAQDIVERIDRQRVEAEESAVRAREKSRKLAEARAIDLAMEEGRRIGFEEGLNQGRMIGHVEGEHRELQRSRKDSSESSETIPSRKSRSTARSKKRSIPEERSAVTPRSESSRPEEITIQEAIPPPPRPKSVQQYSPAGPRRSVVLPPDNYIPILNPDSTITLPPPHELSMPILTEPARAASSFNVVQRDQEGDKAKGKMPASYVRSVTPPSPSPAREPPDRERLVPISGSETHEPRSPALYPNRPPLRRREIVMPVPMGQQFLGTPSNPLRQPSSLSPLSLNGRSASNSSIPAIEVETPSTKSPSSEKTAYDPVLLTPDGSTKPVLLPSQHQADHTSGVEPDVNGKETISGMLPNNNLPPGFVPLSPIPGMANLNPYPPGFAPSSGEQSRPDFVYPASPLARSQ